MSLKITDECINCDVCTSECPNEAIFAGDEYHQINPERCTECVGYFSSPQCKDVCPVDCIISDPDNNESKKELEEKFKRLREE